MSDVLDIDGMSQFLRIVKETDTPTNITSTGKTQEDDFASITQAPDGTFTITYQDPDLALSGTPRANEPRQPLTKIPTYQQAVDLRQKDFDIFLSIAMMKPAITVDSTFGSGHQVDGPSGQLGSEWSNPGNQREKAQLNRATEAVGDFAADPKQQAKMYLQFHTGMMDPSTLPKIMAITPNLQLAVQPPVNFKGSHEEILANLSAANKRLPKELQVGWDELKQLGGVSDTIAMTGEPHPDKYNPATDPTDPNPVATPYKIQESLDRIISLKKILVG